MNKKLFPIFLLAVFLVLPVIVNAQAVGTSGWITVILGKIAGIMFAIFDGLVVIMIVYAGILYLIARGDPSKVTMANKALIWALVGVAVGILANLASGIVNWLLNLPPPGP